MSLSQRTVLVTGGSRGIGSAIVQLLAQKEGNVIFTYKDNDTAAQKVVTVCRDNGVRVSAYKVDTRDYDQLKRFAKEIQKEYGKIDAVVNNAGIKKDKTVLYMDPNDWQEVLETNLTGTYNTTKAILPYMVKCRKGRIVNISSISGINGLSGQTNYSASKAGIIGFTKALAKEVAAYGISVNAIAPGAVETEMLQEMPAHVSEKLIRNIPLNRSCLPQEVAMLVNALVDEDITPRYLTGQVIALDGGIGL